MGPVGISSYQWNAGRSPGYLERMLHLLSGKPIPDNRGNITINLDDHIQSVQGKGRYEDEMFIIKYFKKGSAHITFKRLELIDRINDIIASTFLLCSQPDPEFDSLSISKGTAGTKEGTYFTKPNKIN